MIFDGQDLALRMLQFVLGWGATLLIIFIFVYMIYTLTNPTLEQRILRCMDAGLSEATCMELYHD